MYKLPIFPDPAKKESQDPLRAGKEATDNILFCHFCCKTYNVSSKMAAPTFPLKAAKGKKKSK